MGNSTTFLRVEKTKNYTVILNSLITSTSLTSDEKSLLFHILSLPDDWVIYKDYFKNYYSGCISDKKIDNAWKGLETKGYLKKDRVKRQDGKFSSWHYEVREVPFTDIPKSDMSENQTIGNTTSQEKGDIQSTNKPNTNEQSTKETNLDNTSIILGKKEINNTKNEETIQAYMQRSVNLNAMNKLFENTGINWVEEINSLSVEDFSSKYDYLASNNQRWLYDMASNYKRLNPDASRNNLQPLKGIENTV
jgi:hypothetical protein